MGHIDLRLVDGQWGERRTELSICDWFPNAVLLSTLRRRPCISGHLLLTLEIRRACDTTAIYTDRTSQLSVLLHSMMDMNPAWRFPRACLLRNIVVNYASV